MGELFAGPQANFRIPIGSGTGEVIQMVVGEGCGDCGVDGEGFVVAGGGGVVVVVILVVFAVTKGILTPITHIILPSHHINLNPAPLIF